MLVKNRDLMNVATALGLIVDLKPKKGLLGFKFALAQRHIEFYATPIGESMNEILMHHIERDDKQEPVLHSSGKGYKLATPDAYQEDLDTLLDTEIEVTPWPPVVFTSEDIDKAEIEIPNRAYRLLGPLLENI
jgi:hypothetical protein